jgi:hypothetical protein
LIEAILKNDLFKISWVDLYLDQLSAPYSNLTFKQIISLAALQMERKKLAKYFTA